MAIPIKINQPLVKKTLPISNLETYYRPFTVKEEKILLIANESEKLLDMMTAFAQVISNCIENAHDVMQLPLYDLEYLFLLIRAAAVSNHVVVKIRDNEDNEYYDVEFDIETLLDKASAEIHMPEKRIQLTDQVGVVMKDLTFGTFVKNVETPTSDTEMALRTLARLIDTFYDEENAYKASDYSEDEMLEFLESLPSSTAEKLNTYVDSLPRLRLTTQYNTPKGPKEFSLEGLNDFFQYV